MVTVGLLKMRPGFLKKGPSFSKMCPSFFNDLVFQERLNQFPKIVTQTPENVTQVSKKKIHCKNFGHKSMVYYEKLTYGKATPCHDKNY